MNVSVHDDRQYNRTKPEPDYAVYVQDFEDNYHREGNEPTTELEFAARRIKRRYRKLDDYLRAVSIYNEYMIALVGKYGSFDCYKQLLKEDEIHDFIPPKPRLKSNARNRMLLKNKFILSAVNFKSINMEHIDEYAQHVLVPLNEDAGVYTDDELPIVSDESKRMRKLTKVASMSNGQASIGTVARISNISKLADFYGGRNTKKREEMESELQGVSITEIVNGEVEFVDPGNDPDEQVLYRGRYVTAAVREQLEMYRQLGESGWDVVKLQRRIAGNKVSLGTQSRVRQLLKENNKRMKKGKKKNKKAKREVDNFLVNLSGDNGFTSFEEYEKDMLDMSMTNLFK